VNPEEIGGSPLNTSLNMPPSEFPEEVWSLQLFGAMISVACVECHATSGSFGEVNQVPDVVADGATYEDASCTSPLELWLRADDGPDPNDSREEAWRGIYTLYWEVLPSHQIFFPSFAMKMQK
jgi:hypothetical protein